MLSRTLIEPDRIKALQRYRILDSFPDPAFERLTNMAAQIFEAPIALISLVDEDRVWFKSHWGLKAKQVSRVDSFCTHTISNADVLVVPDATGDPRFSENPMVKSENGIRFYAGAPLRTLDRYHLGALCIIDTNPRQDWNAFKSRVLTDLAAITVDEMELRRMAMPRHNAESTVLKRQANPPKASDLSFGRVQPAF